MIVQALIARLTKVKRTGEGRWVACCPVHDDNSPSLVITEKEDRVLIHCFAGCPVEHVVSAVGLGMSDLFQPRNTDDPHGIYTGKQRRRYFPAKEVLACLAYEIAFLALCASDMAKGGRLTSADHDRLMLAAERFTTAKELTGA